MPEYADTVLGLRVGDNVAVRVIDGGVKYYKVTNRDNIIYPQTYSAIAAGATETYASINNLDPTSDELYQLYSVMIDGNIKLYLKQPAATQRWGTNRSPTGGPLLDRLSPLGSGFPVSVWILEDYPPNIQMVNDTNVSISPRIWWYGWRYTVTKLKDKPSIFTMVQVGGVNR